jgi:hypothetical protein
MAAGPEAPGAPPFPVARLLWPALATLLLGLALAARTPVPSEDGISYLWIAQQFAAGDFREALSTVFPPGFSLLLAPFLWLGVDPEWAAIGLGIACTLLTLLPLARCAEAVVPGGGLPAAWLLAANPLLARLAVEVYSEPPFLLLMAWGTWWGLTGRFRRLGIAAAIGFWIRPEGLLLVPAFLAASPLRAWRSLAPAALGVLLLAVLRWSLGHGFHEQRDDLPQRGDLLGNLLLVPAAWFEAFGLVALLALLPHRVFVRDGAHPARGRLPLAVAAILQIAVVCTFVVRRRFFLSAAVPVVALAGAVVARWRPRVQLVVVAVAVVLGAIVALRGTIDPDRAAERTVGVHLRSRLQPGRTVTGDLPRVVWFAGQRPLPPRRFDAARLAAMAGAPEVQFVVLATRRERDGEPAVADLPGPDFAPAELPPELVDACRWRGIAVFQRR